MQRSGTATPTVSSEHFGRIGDTDVHRYVLANPGGITVRVLDLGGVVQSIDAPDRHGTPANVVLGFADLEGYLANNRPDAGRVFFGALIGRYANRIGGAAFSLDGSTYRVSANENDNCLHGGVSGFDTHVWQASTFTGEDGVGVRLSHVSPDGDQGFPGRVTTAVTYRLDQRNRLTISYRAETDAPTVLNLTNHTYWNLAGEGSGDVHDHLLTIRAGSFCAVDESLIPQGDPVPVDGTPFDFREATPIGARIGTPDPQLRIGHGYDHNWVLDPGSFAARAHEPGSGRTLTTWTTEPGLQFYSGNFLTDALVGTSGRPYHHGAGFAVEAQHFPDSPNRPDFPSTVLRPGETYHQETVYELTVG
ncbi:aldose epimerase family protein [Lentzea sp. BCCO 10_0856]|uniref:Aldose 1-epimerase n=1 Tax=Lentzea miocenica TaxID=3095431 RepID=A0ABU4TC03_9PSEU|nr:aldose epimerase family protein [Lentzea sp. BCCO 10_0856]MDX8035717.1 aldose epimerase family protein [Lentzea sp. BCCO 10_0856]